MKYVKHQINKQITTYYFIYFKCIIFTYFKLYYNIVICFLFVLYGKHKPSVDQKATPFKKKHAKHVFYLEIATFFMSTIMKHLGKLLKQFSIRPKGGSSTAPDSNLLISENR